MATNRVGPPVRGADLFGRERFVALLWRKLEAGHVLLAAPRRFGKTSVMYRLIDQPEADYKIIHADLECFQEASDLIMELIVKISADTKLGKLLDGLGTVSKDIWTGLRSAVSEVEVFECKFKLKEQLHPNWQENGRLLLKRISDSGQPVLFILDEFPMMIDRMARLEGRREEAITLLRWLRAMRVSPEMKNVRFLIAGSIGIDSVLNDLGEISAINDFEKLRLEPFSPETAADFLTALVEADPLPLTDACKQKMLDLIGVLVPYFLQILFSEVSKDYALGEAAITPEKIEQIYRTKVLGVDCKTYFDHYYGRLRDYYQPQEEKAVKLLLRHLAVSGAMTSNSCYALYRSALNDATIADSFQNTLTNLENDFYIKYNEETAQYEFACKLLRDWWLRHYAISAGE